MIRPVCRCNLLIYMELQQMEGRVESHTRVAAQGLTPYCDHIVTVFLGHYDRRIRAVIWTTSRTGEEHSSHRDQSPSLLLPQHDQPIRYLEATR